MSVQAIAWVFDSAPELTAHLLPTLMAIADEADAEGRNAWPSQDRLAQRARKSVRQVRYDLKALEGLGLIRRGDQRIVMHLREDRRPVVWDLAMGDRQPAAARDAEPQATGDRQSTTGSELPGGNAASPRPAMQRPTTGNPLPTTRDNPTTNPEPPPVSPPSRACRLPEGWRPSERLIAWALQEVPELAGERGRRETANFVDHWRSASGANARKHDWDAAWRKWMRKAADSLPAAVRGRKQAETDEWFARAMARAQARERIGDSDGNGGALPQSQGVLPPAGHG